MGARHPTRSYLISYFNRDIWSFVIIHRKRRERENCVYDDEKFIIDDDDDIMIYLPRS